MAALWTLFLLFSLVAAFAAWLAALMHERGIRPLRRLAAARLSGIAAFCLFTWFGGAKERCRVSALPPNGSSTAIVTNADWLAFGAYEDWFHIPEGGWCFRFGSNLTERLTVLSCGDVYANLRDASNRISVLGLPLSIVPAANWCLLPDGRESLFWHSVTPSNTLLLTWWNALVNRDTNLPVTVQAELFPDGAAAIQYDFAGLADASILSNAAARVWRDGVEETAPLQTGTVVEVAFPAPPVTGNTTLDGVYARIASGDSNAYCFVDAAVPKGPTRIEVSCDGVSMLGSYAILAEPGETNRLPLLIGPRYTVSSEVAFSHFAPVPSEMQTEESHPVATNLTDRLAEVQWPVFFGLDEVSVSASETVYALRVTPDFLCGMVSWDGDTGGTPPLRLLPLRSGGNGCACGCQSYATNTVSHASDCPCSDCTASGGYGYEGHVERFEVRFPGDTGGGEPPGPGGEGEDLPPDPQPSVSVSFEEPVVIFEDEYEDTPGVFMPRRSTTTKLTVTANGGENGGTLSLSVVGGLDICAGQSDLPGYVPPGQTIEWEANYEGIATSGSRGGAVATVTITDSVTGQKPSATANATVVEIEIRENESAPEGNCPLRHVYGVREIIQCWQHPNLPQLNWTVTGSGSNCWDGAINRYFCPLQPEINPITVSIGNVEHTPLISIIAPQNVQAENVRRMVYGDHPNEAGWVGMEFEYYVLPKYVSFSGIAIEEVPCEEGTHSGHFSNTYFSNIWSHTRDNGAGRWHDVDSSNLFATDSAQIGQAIPKIKPNGQVTFEEDGIWTDGDISWNIPFGWNEKGTRGETPQVGTFAGHIRQNMAIFFDGRAGVRKFTHQLVRTTNDVFTLNGVVVQ